MDFAHYQFYIKSDLHRYTGKSSFWCFCLTYINNVGYRLSFWIRTSKYLKQFPFLHFISFITRLILMRCTHKYQIYIPYNTSIGPGFYIGHPSCIIINYDTVIGKNCNISSGVVIGISNRGKIGCPEIGDDVFIGPGAKIFGKIKIGNNVVIGANSVVTSDVPDNAVVVGIPGQVISYKGSTGYINRTDY